MRRLNIKIKKWKTGGFFIFGFWFLVFDFWFLIFGVPQKLKQTPLRLDRVRVLLFSEMTTPSSVESIPKEALESVLCYNLPVAYEPIQRRQYRTTEKDIELIQMWNKVVSTGTNTSVEWFTATKGYSHAHRESLLDRANSLRHEKVEDGSDKWRQIVYGPSEAEYNEMDRIARQQWVEDAAAATEVCTALAPLFRTFPLEDQAFWYRESCNPHAWVALTSLLTEAEKKAIEERNEQHTQSELGCDD